MIITTGSFCAKCGVAHSEDAPHHMGLYYRMKFYQEEGRWPTLADAFSDCPAWTKEVLKVVLQRLGLAEEEAS